MRKRWKDEGERRDAEWRKVGKTVSEKANEGERKKKEKIVGRKEEKRW